MQSKSAALKEQINEIDRKIQEGVNLSSRNQLEADRNNLNEQLLIALTEEANQQVREERIQEATAESENILDDIEIAGVPIAESGLSELAFNILNAKVQAKFVAKVESMLQEISEIQFNHRAQLTEYIQRSTESEITISTLQAANKDLEVVNYQLGLDNDALGIKVTKGAEMLAEATATIEEQNTAIKDYKKKELQGYSAPQKVVLTTSEQVAQQEAQLKASQIPVTSMEVDPNDFAKKTWVITTVSPVEVRNIHYFEKGLYRVVSQEEAEQIRAAIELQAAIIPVQPESIEYVTELEAPAQEPTFQADKAIEATDNEGNTGVERNESLDASLGQAESEVITLESLQAQIHKINSHIGLVA